MSTPSVTPNPSLAARIRTESPDEIKEFTRQYIETADRSFINERLQVRNLPPHFHGEWVAVDPFSQFNAKAKGFVDGTEYLTDDNVVHYTPEGGVIGDVKFMVMSKQRFQAMQEIDQLNAQRRTGISLTADEEYRMLAEKVGANVDGKNFGATNERNTTRILEGAEVDTVLKG